MDCESIRPLIEAYCDDELDVATVARVVAHLDECPACLAEVRRTEERTASVRLLRPVDSCPAALKERVLSSVALAAPPPSASTRKVRPATAVSAVAALAVVAAAAALAARRPGPPPHVPGALSEAAVVRQLTGEVFCVRCALRELFPQTPLVDVKHLPVLRTDDGEVVTILDNELAERKLAVRGCAGRRVTVTARYLPSQAIAEVLEVFPEDPPTIAAHPPPR